MYPNSAGTSSFSSEPPLIPHSLDVRLFLRDIRGHLQLRGYCSDPIPPKLVGSFILVQSPSVSGLPVSCSQMSLVFASNCTARGLIVLGHTTFATDFDVISYRASVFLVSRLSCVIVESEVGAAGLVQQSTEKEVAKRFPQVVVKVDPELRFASCAETRVVWKRGYRPATAFRRAKKKSKKKEKTIYFFETEG